MVVEWDISVANSAFIDDRQCSLYNLGSLFGMTMDVTQTQSLTHLPSSSAVQFAGNKRRDATEPLRFSGQS